MRNADQRSKFSLLSVEFLLLRTQHLQLKTHNLFCVPHSLPGAAAPIDRGHPEFAFRDANSGWPWNNSAIAGLANQVISADEKSLRTAESAGSLMTASPIQLGVRTSSRRIDSLCILSLKAEFVLSSHNSTLTTQDS